MKKENSTKAKKIISKLLKINKSAISDFNQLASLSDSNDSTKKMNPVDKHATETSDKRNINGYRSSRG